MRLTTVPTMALMILSSVASASDVIATLPIDAVTVYRDSAIVVRAGVVEVPAGEHRLVIRGLPDAVDPATLRLSAGSAALKLGGIEVQRVVEAELVNAQERALNRRLRDIADQKSAIEDEVISAQAQLQLLNGVIEAPTGSGTNAARMDAATIASLVSVIGASDAAARARVREAKLQLRALDEQAEKVKADIAKVATDHRARTELRAAVIAASAASAPVRIEYQVMNVDWTWQYEARLDSQKKTVALVRQAQLQQGTGEDWNDIELKISTARPSLNATTPPLTSLFVGLQTLAEGGDTTGDVSEIVVTGWSRSAQSVHSRAPREREYVPEVAAKSTAEIFTTDFVADYRIPGRVSVAADRQPRLYPITDDRMQVDLVSRANLAADRAAYLEAKFTYEHDVPLDAGRVQLFRDNAFVGIGALPMVLPGADVRIPFGQDQRVRIVVRDEREESGNVGLVVRGQVNEHKRRFEITSFHTVAIPIEVIDRVPVPRDDDIKVELLKGATPPTSTDVAGHAGLYLWRFAGEPRKTETVRHYYAVKFPRNKGLTASEGG